MDPDRWARVKALYHSALARDPGERAAFVEDACRDDREVRQEVESLLAQATGGCLLDRPAWQKGEFGATESAAGPEQAAGPLVEGTAARRHPFVWLVWLVLAGLAAAFGYAA